MFQDCKLRDYDEGELALVRLRATTELTINHALKWLDQFEHKASKAMVTKVSIHINACKIQLGRSDFDALRRAQHDLLNISQEAALALPNDAQAKVLLGSTSRKKKDPWQRSDYFSPAEHRTSALQEGAGRIFVSYAHADEIWLKRLLTHLSPLERAGLVTTWHDREIPVGLDWERAISSAIIQSTCSILLVSANFMASDYIQTKELQAISALAAERGVVVFPVVIGHCLLDFHPYLKRAQCFNDPLDPLSGAGDHEIDLVLSQLARSIGWMVKKARSQNSRFA